MRYVKDSAWFTSVSLSHKPFFRFRFAEKVVMGPSMGLGGRGGSLHELNYFLTLCLVVVHHSEMALPVRCVACHRRFFL